MEIKKLFDPFQLGDLTLQNRFVMAPMTRSRASLPGNIPNDLMAEYYSQRAGAGLIITEATQISLQGQGYARTPGIYTGEQTEGWKKVTNAVHQNKGKIFLQLWHVGRVSSSKINGLQPIAPSAIRANDTSVYSFDRSDGDATFIPVETPREMTRDDIRKVISEFVLGAQNAVEAGFDGVEIHAANGYLLDQFLRSNSNQRTDQYGGSKENRIRLLVEVSKAVVNAIGREKTGVRISPFIKFKDMDDPEILETMIRASERLNDTGIAYLHLCEADWDDAPAIPGSFRVEIREKFRNVLIATGNKTPPEGEELLRSGMVDLVGFGRKFISNPDFPERVKNHIPLTEIKNTHTLFGGGSSQGYTDYPFFYDTVF